MSQQRTLLADLSSPKWVANIFQRAVAYAAMYASIHQVIQGLRTMVDYQLEQENAARIFAALTEGTDEYSVKLERAHKIEKELVGLTYQWGGALTEVNAAAMELYRAGIPSNQVVKSTEAVMLLARLTGDTIAQSASAMVTYNMVYGEMAGTADEAGKSVGELADILAYMANASRMSTQDISTFSNYALAMSKAAGISAEATAAMAITLTNAGFNASTAGTQVRKFASMLGDQTPKVQRFFKQIGVSQTSFAAMIQDMETSDDALVMFIRRLQDIDDASFTRISGSLQLLMRNMVTSMRTNGDEMIRQMDRVANDSAGSLDAAKESTEAWVVTFQRLKEQLKSVGDQYTTEFLKSLTESMKPLLDNPGAIKAYFDGLVEGLTSLGIAVGVLGGTVGIVKIGTAIATLMTALKGAGLAAGAVALGPWALAIGGIGTAAWYAKKSYDDFVGSSDKAIDTAKAEKAKKEMKEVAKATTEAAKANIMYARSTREIGALLNNMGSFSEDSGVFSNYSSALKKAMRTAWQNAEVNGEMMSTDAFVELIFSKDAFKNAEPHVKKRARELVTEVTGIIDQAFEDKADQKSSEFALTDNMIKKLSSDMGQITKLMRAMQVEDASGFSSLVEGQRNSVDRAVKGTLATIRKNRKLVVEVMGELPDMVEGTNEVLKNISSPDVDFDDILNAQRQVLLLQAELQENIDSGQYSDTQASTMQSEIDNISLAVKALQDYYKGLKDIDNITESARESNRDDVIKGLNQEYTALVRNYTQEQTFLDNKYTRISAIRKQYEGLLTQEKELADIRAEEGLFDTVESKNLPNAYAEAMKAAYETANAERELGLLRELNSNRLRQEADLRRKIAETVKVEEEALKEYTALKEKGKGFEESELNLQELQSKLQEDRIKLGEIELAIEEGKTEEARRLLNLRRKEFQEAEAKVWSQGSFWDGFMVGAEEQATDTFRTMAEQGKDLADTLRDSLNSGFNDFFDMQSDNWLDFGSLAEGVLQQILRQIIQTQLASPLAGALTTGVGAFFSGMFGGGAVAPTGQLAAANNIQFAATGAVLQQGSIIPYATGGVVQSPTLFPMVGNNTGLMGEAGPEAIMPLTRVGGDLGVKAQVQPQKIEIINKGGQEMKVTSASQRMDTEGMVLSIVVDGIHKNKMGIRDMLGGR